MSSSTNTEWDYQSLKTQITYKVNKRAGEAEKSTLKASKKKVKDSLFSEKSLQTALLTAASSVVEADAERISKYAYDASANRDHNPEAAKSPKHGHVVTMNTDLQFELNGVGQSELDPEKSTVSGQVTLSIAGEPAQTENYSFTFSQLGVENETGGW